MFFVPFAHSAPNIHTLCLLRTTYLLRTTCLLSVGCCQGSCVCCLDVTSQLNENLSRIRAHCWHRM